MNFFGGVKKRACHRRRTQSSRDFVESNLKGISQVGKFLAALHYQFKPNDSIRADKQHFKIKDGCVNQAIQIEVKQLFSEG